MPVVRKNEAGAEDGPDKDTTSKAKAKRAKKVGGRRNAPTFIDQIVAKFQEELEKATLKPSVTDYIKLLQLQRELEERDERLREIRVTWVDPKKDESATEE